MGEISFRYMRKFEPVYETPFQYWFANSKEYSFAYKRYIALSDTSILNDPVAISKVATGFYNLYELFVDKVTHPLIEQKAIEIKKQSKNISAKDKFIGLYRYNFMFAQDILNMKRIDDNTLSYLSKHDVLLFKDKLELNKINTITLGFSQDYKGAMYDSSIIYASNSYYLDKYNNSILLDKINNQGLKTYSDIYGLHRTNKLKIDNFDAILMRPGLELNIYGSEMLLRDRLGFNILQNLLLHKNFDKGLNIYYTILTQSFDKHLNIYIDYMTSGEYNILNIYDTNSLIEPKYDKKDIYILQILFGKLSGKTTDIISNSLYTFKTRGLINLHNDLDVKVYDKNMSLVNIIAGYMYDKKININKAIYGYMYNKQITLNHSVSGFVANNNIFTIHDVFANKTNYEASTLNYVTGNKDNDRQIYLSEGYNIEKQISDICLFDIDTFAITSSKYSFVLDNVFTITEAKDIMIKSGTWSILKSKNVFLSNISFTNANYKQSMTDKGIVSISKNKSNILLDNIDEYVFKNNKGMFVTNIVSISTNIKLIDVLNQIFVNVLPKDLLVTENTSVFKEKFNTVIHDSSMFLSIILKSIWTEDIVNITNNQKPFIILDNTDSFIKQDKIVNRYPDMQTVDKQRESMYILKDVYIYKETKEFSIQDTISSISKYKHKLPFIQNNTWIIKDSYSLSLYNQLVIDKDIHIAQVYKQGHEILKQFSKADLPSIDAIIKNQIPADVINGISDQFGGMIIPVSKVRRQGFIDYIDKMVTKYIRNGYITHDIFSSVLPKKAQCDLDVFFDKESHKAFIDYENGIITKSKIYGYMHDDIFIDIEKKKAYTDKYIFISKNKLDAWIEDISTASKLYHQGHVHNDEFSTLKIKKAIIPGSLFVDKDDQICYYDYGVFTNKSEYASLLQNNILVTSNNRETRNIADLVSGAIKKELDTYYEYGIFSSKIIRESLLYKQLDDVHKISQELAIHPDDFGNWAWVYETPDPIDPVYGIDELLLPENDTRYSDFENIIFNKETMKPRRPVKIINDTTFIAKYPHKHPIPEYSDVAVNYDDSAVKYEQYYGIRTEIMHKVFLKYYRIWQSKIFEFGTMTMVQSVKKILEYLYSWIMIYFPPDEIEQALRVFKLIRWYGESAIIQNSQYIVSYEYDTLESKLTTGTCAIPNNLGPGNDSMIIDASLGVIKNNPIYIGTGPAYVEFHIDSHKNTSITFSLSNTVGSVNIYINDVLVDIVSHSALNLTYQIPYTGDVNIVKIEKLAAHNLNQYFYIGNIKVPELSFKDLSIEFDPTVKMGNKPLDEIAKKMMQYANLYDDIQEMYYNIRRSNIGIQETYSKMIEYWNLHHQNKTKGKRLTIKEV